VNQFPEFFEAIQRQVRQVATHHFNDGTAIDVPGLQFLPFSICGFIDCSIYRIYRPFSGPDDMYIIGSPRKRRYRRAQRAVFSGHRKCHAIKMETFMCPNGISFVFGPVSARQFDVAGVLHMSGLDQWLVAIQQGRPHIYSAFGDKVYGANGLHCIRSYFGALRQGMLTPDEVRCNARIKACRESIEWNYGEISTIFKLAADPSNYKLGKRHPYAHEQLRVIHLLVNMYHCFNGDKASAMFNCRPPVLEEYLRIN
jgi:hypothetical protein